MAYADIDQTIDRTTAFRSALVSAGKTVAKETVATLLIARRKWGYHKSVAEFSSMNDHTLREIGVHRSEITSIANHGKDLSRARYYR